MKTFRLIGMALVAVLVCVNILSCGKDEDVIMVAGNFADQKRLVKMEGVEVYNLNAAPQEFCITFDYNDQGQVVEVVDDNFSDKYVWENNTIKTSAVYESLEYTTTYVLVNGLVKQIIQESPYGSDKETLPYNKDGRYIGYDVEWNGDKIVQYFNGDYMYTPENYTTCSKGYFPLLDNGDALCMAHPEIFGMRTTQLPVDYILTDCGTDRQYTGTYEYEFDSEGYITKIVNNIDYGNKQSVYVLTWE